MVLILLNLKRECPKFISVKNRITGIRKKSDHRHQHGSCQFGLSDQCANALNYTK